MRFDLSYHGCSNLLWQYRCGEFLVTWVRSRCIDIPGFGSTPTYLHPLLSAYRFQRLRLFLGTKCSSIDKKLLLVMFTSLVFI